MKLLFLAGSCWAFCAIYVIGIVKTDFREGVYLWPATKLAFFAVVAWYVSSVLMRPSSDEDDDDDARGWQPMPPIVRVILAGALFLGGIGMMFAGSLFFGRYAIAIGIFCLPVALYVLFAGKYNTDSAP